MPPLTDSQLAAVRSTGNTLVNAGAGAGKTSTLVEKCLWHILNPDAPIHLDEILMVTFTEAAAAEMKARIRERLGAEFERDPLSPRLAEQLARLDHAFIGTLHGFCLHLIRENFQRLHLDPALVVLSEEQARLLQAEVLDALFEQVYETPEGETVRHLVEEQARGDEAAIRRLVLRLHQFSQTLPEPERWFQQQLEALRQPEARAWRDALPHSLDEWRSEWRPLLESEPPENTWIHECASQLACWPENPSLDDPRVIEALGHAAGLADANWPRGTAGKFREPFKNFFKEAGFLFSLVHSDQSLAEDWALVRGRMAPLLELAQRFGTEFAAAKHLQGALDFQDLEQFALRLLCNSGAPTDLALAWRMRLKWVCVDEYQDINAAQDAILRMLSRDESPGNRFLVGDVKQSIYRFRLANPAIFQAYHRDWQAPASGASVVPLQDNFRSRERILDFANALFGDLMRAALGNVEYDIAARLRLGNAGGRPSWASSSDPETRVEIQFIQDSEGQAQPEEDETPDPIAERTRLEKEAHWVASKMIELRASGRVDENGAPRPLRWSDFAVLLRSVTGKAETFVKVLTQAGIPVHAAHSGFYSSMEIDDLLHLLILMDNPLQDLPLIAILRSPVGGMSLDDLAEVRAAGPKLTFWHALIALAERKDPQAASPSSATLSAPEKARSFLERFHRWRRLTRDLPLSQCLETLLDETFYLDWLATQTRAAQRQANVQRLLTLAQQFDPFQRQGLRRFLRFIEAQKEADAGAEPLPPADADAVLLTSIHRSKGLEFPIVIVPDLSKTFNMTDLSAPIVLDDTYGLCCQIVRPEFCQHYPSYPYWAAARKQRRDLLAEELRLLYVAFTRAEERLILVATATAKAAEKWSKRAETPWTLLRFQSARSPMDWLGPWLVQRANTSGTQNLFAFSTAPAPETLAPISEPRPAGLDLAVDPGKLTWRYPFPTPAREASKASVSMLRRRQAQVEEADSRRFASPQTGVSAKPGPALSAVEIGLAHHTLIEHLNLSAELTVEDIARQAAALARSGVLSPEGMEALDLEGIAAFWSSALGRVLLENQHELHRELEFTARIPLAKLVEIGVLPAVEPGVAGEFIVIQGIADLVRIGPDAIDIIDFKTDKVAEGKIEEKAGAYAVQLRLYAEALGGIYNKQVRQTALFFIHSRRLWTPRSGASLSPAARGGSRVYEP